MRRSILALTLAAILSLTLSGVASAAQSSTTLDITGSAMFSSILGGQSNGQVVLSGDVSNDEIGTLRGSINFALRDESITVTPVSTIAFSTQQFPVQWQLLTCEQYFCYWTYGTATYEHRSGSGPVDLRLGSLKGSGTLSVSTAGSCVSNCPPPGAYVNYYPQAQANLSGGVTSSKDAGTLNIFGTPVIH